MKTSIPFTYVGLAGGLLLLGAGCEKQAPRIPEKLIPPSATATAKAPQTRPESHGGGAAAAAPAAEGAVSGTIAETMDAAGYTYVRLDTGSGPVWAAVPKTPVKVGQAVSIVNWSRMEKFTSKTLNRTFPTILFGSLGGAAAPMPHGQPGAKPAEPTPKEAHKGQGEAERVAFDKPLPKAEGAQGRTVAEVLSQRAALNGKKVAIRGKVTKFNARIMGRNWLHLQDGTGDAKGFDLTVTTQDTVAVGDVVKVEGVVRTDQKFGAGYDYDVLLEQAKVSR